MLGYNSLDSCWYFPMDCSGKGGNVSEVDSNDSARFRAPIWINYSVKRNVMIISLCRLKGGGAAFLRLVWTTLPSEPVLQLTFSSRFGKRFRFRLTWSLIALNSVLEGDVNGVGNNQTRVSMRLATFDAEKKTREGKQATSLNGWINCFIENDV